jgi:hypothetical protein
VSNQQGTPGGWTVNAGTDSPWTAVTVSQPGTPYSAQITPAGFLAILSYANTYFSGATIPAGDQRCPSVQITTSHVVMNVASGDAATVQAELVSLLNTPGNVT